MFRIASFNFRRRLFSTNNSSNFSYPIWKSLGVFVATSGGLWLYYQNERSKMTSKRNLEKAGSVGTPLIGGPFSLIDTQDRPFSDLNLLGKYYLLYFGFTHCPDICPEELSKIGEAVEFVKKEIKSRNLEDELVPVFVTCDPERDTPQVIKEYLKDFGNDFIGLTGAPDVIKNVAKSFRIYYRPASTSSDGDYLVDHSIFFYLMGPDGKFICNFGREINGEECGRSIMKEIETRKKQQQ